MLVPNTLAQPSRERRLINKLSRRQWIELRGQNFGIRTGDSKNE
jgi:hypothetical protein